MLRLLLGSVINRSISEMVRQIQGWVNLWSEAVRLFLGAKCLCFLLVQELEGMLSASGQTANKRQGLDLHLDTRLY